MPPQKKTGRPAIGPTVKTSLATTWIDRLNTIAAKMATFTKEVRAARGLPAHGLHTIESRAWDRSTVIAALIQAGAGQFAETVLGDKYAVKCGDLCPLCWGYVDGPHANSCGYFGPLSERDPDRDTRIRNVLFRAGIPSRFTVVEGHVAEVFSMDPRPFNPEPTTD